MPVTSASAREIEDQEFPSARRGYDMAAVRAFLETVAGRIGDLQQSLERSTADSLKLSQELELAKLEVRTLEDELAERRLRHRELSRRLELAEALREDAIARALAAEFGRQYAENLLAQVEARQHHPPDPGPEPVVDLREPAGYVRQSVAARVEVSGGRLKQGSGPSPSAISVIFSETDEAVRALLSTSFQQTEEQIRVIEEAAEALVETTKAQAQRILEGARQDADRITNSARQIAELWDSVLGEVRDDIAKGPSALTNLRAAVQAPTDPTGGRAHDLRSGVEAPARFTTNQARAAATSLHAAARDDLHLAEFWIQEAEQEAGDDTMQTSRGILEEAHQLLTMAEELGHPAADLVEQYRELSDRLERLEGKGAG
jgi:DivIVA domain-containing protein